MKEPVKQPVDEGYALTNPPPRLPEWRVPPSENTRQRVLFSGMDCLPGQQDLFETDGEAPLVRTIGNSRGTSCFESAPDAADQRTLRK